MTVTVKLMSLFKKYRYRVPDEKASLPQWASVRDLAVQIGLSLESLRIITENGKQETLDRVLAGGDLISFSPAIGTDEESSFGAQIRHSGTSRNPRFSRTSRPVF